MVSLNLRELCRRRASIQKVRACPGSRPSPRDAREASIASMVPMATTLPSASAAMRSQTVCRLSRSCVTMNTVGPSVCCSVSMSASKSPAAIGSRPEVGSSRKTISGSSASARASADALGHAAGQLRGKLVAVGGRQPHHLELGERHLSHQRLRQVEILAHRELHVLQRRQRGEQRALLEQDAPAPLDGPPLGLARPCRDRRPAPRSCPAAWAAGR